MLTYYLYMNTNESIPRLNSSSRFQTAFDTEMLKELNTYRNWGAFGLLPEVLKKTEESRDAKGNKVVKETPGINHAEEVIDPLLGKTGKGGTIPGTKSIFNNSNAVKYHSQAYVEYNAPLLDEPSIREMIRKRGDCSIKELVRASSNDEMGRAIYNYSDFMYCKHLGRISNNYLVTLRRFPFPCGDHINHTFIDNSDLKKINAHLPDVGRMVTWIGTPGNEMGNILKYKVLMPYKEQEAQIQEVNGTAEEGGFLGSLLNLSSTSYANAAVRGTAGTSAIGLLNTGAKLIPGVGNILGKGMASPPDSSWAYHRDQTKTYGNADVISKTHRRAGGDEGGLTFEQEISLVFDYELRSFDGINGRAAFLDLIGNILAVTYTNGRFWGGAYRGSGFPQTNVFTNLPIFNLSDQNMTFSGITNAALSSIQQIGRAFAGGADITTKEGIISAIKNLASNIGKTLLGAGLNALGRPQKQGLNSLLNPAPVGLWHLTIGNPKHPIMSMGNMILTDVQIEHYGPLGLDDFPTGIKVEIKLKHAKPRDASEIENMYLMGENRIYQPMGKHIENMYKTAVNYKEDTKVSKGDETSKLLDGNVDVTTADAAEETKKLEKVYMKYFGSGIDKQQNILWAGMEAHLGSQKAKDKKTADAEMEALRKEQEADKKRRK